MFKAIRNYFRGRKLKKIKEWRVIVQRKRAYRDMLQKEVDIENKSFTTDMLCPFNTYNQHEPRPCSEKCINYMKGSVKRYLTYCDYRTYVQYEKISPACKLWAKEITINNRYRSSGIF